MLFWCYFLNAFLVSSADKNKQKEDKNHLKVPNQHQKRKVKYEPKKSFDESSSWDMEAIEEGVIRNNNIVHYDPPVTKDHPQKTEKNAIMWKRFVPYSWNDQVKFISFFIFILLLSAYSVGCRWENDMLVSGYIFLHTLI